MVIVVNVIMKKLQVSCLAFGHARFQPQNYGPIILKTRQCGFWIPLAPSIPYSREPLTIGKSIDWYVGANLVGGRSNWTCSCKFNIGMFSTLSLASISLAYWPLCQIKNKNENQRTIHVCSTFDIFGIHEGTIFWNGRPENQRGSSWWYQIWPLGTMSSTKDWVVKYPLSMMGGGRKPFAPLPSMIGQCGAKLLTRLW